MAASVTVADHDLACATAIAVTPVHAPSANGNYVLVRVNGIGYTVGNATRTAVDCYFSGDGGATARAFSAIVATDLLYWNGSIAGFQLAVTDKVDFIYNIAVS
jgi:hypothetical protein